MREPRRRGTRWRRDVVHLPEAAEHGGQRRAQHHEVDALAPAARSSRTRPPRAWAPAPRPTASRVSQRDRAAPGDTGGVDHPVDAAEPRSAAARALAPSTRPATTSAGHDQDLAAERLELPHLADAAADRVAVGRACRDRPSHSSLGGSPRRPTRTSFAPEPPARRSARARPIPPSAAGDEVAAALRAARAAPPARAGSRTGSKLSTQRSTPRRATTRLVAGRGALREQALGVGPLARPGARRTSIATAAQARVLLRGDPAGSEHGRLLRARAGPRRSPPASRSSRLPSRTSWPGASPPRARASASDAVEAERLDALAPSTGAARRPVGRDAPQVEDARPEASLLPQLGEESLVVLGRSRAQRERSLAEAGEACALPSRAPPTGRRGAGARRADREATAVAQREANARRGRLSTRARTRREAACVSTTGCRTSPARSSGSRDRARPWPFALASTQ